MTTSIGDLILYKNNQLIALNKPAGLGVQDDQTDDKSLLALAEIYSKSKLQLIHRIDRPASGLVLFAKNKRALAHLNKQFQDRTIEKTYLAVVKNKPQVDQGELIHYLIKNPKSNKSTPVEETNKRAKKAQLIYKVLGANDNYFLLEIKLLTGRHHQIRCQLAAIGNPVKGDVKYGFRRKNKDRSIHLHAWKLGFNHPVTNERINLECPVPDEVVWQSFDF